jgi:3-oxoacyl-[acyl-carrier protein] reductase
MDLDLKGKVAVVAGGSRGIGLYIARALADEGCSVALFARKKAELTAAVDALRAKGCSAAGRSLDVTDPGAGEQMAVHTLETFGRIDIFVGNAGGNRRKPFADTTDGDWQDLLDLNLLSHLRSARAVIPAMRDQDSGSIIFISSIFGRESGGAGLSLYNTTKSALISAAKIMSTELAADGIRVNCVAPGSIRFPGGSWDRRCIEQPAAMEEFVAANIPLGRFGTAEEVANVVTFLASSRASLVTGACLNVDGGQSRSLI